MPSSRVNPVFAAAATGAALPLHFDDPVDGVVLARYREAGEVALLHVFPWVFDRDEPEEEQRARWPYEHSIDVYSVTGEGTVALTSGGGSDWQLGMGRLAPGAPIWLSGFRCGSWISGAVSDLAHLETLTDVGAETAIRPSDAPTGAFVAKLRDDEEARRQWDSQLTSFPIEYYPRDPRISSDE